MGTVFLVLVAVVLAAAGAADAAEFGLPISTFNIIALTDTHSWLAGHRHEPTLDATYGNFRSFIDHVEAQTTAAGRDLFVFDSGDLTDGTGLSDASEVKGQYLFPIVELIPFDGLATANHELYTDDRLALMQQPGGFIEHWQGSYLTMNTFVAPAANNQTLGGTYKTIDGRFGTRIVVLGFVYNMNDFAPSVQVIPVAAAVQLPAFFEAMAVEGVDAYVVLSHMDLRSAEVQTVQAAIRSIHAATPIIFLTGHTHYRGFYQWDNTSISLENGRYFDTIGYLAVNLSVADNNNNNNNNNNDDDDVAEYPAVYDEDKSTTTRGGSVSGMFEYVWVTTNTTQMAAVLGLAGVDELQVDSGFVVDEAILGAQVAMGLNDVVGCSPLTMDRYVDVDEPNSLWAFYIYNVSVQSLLELNAEQGGRHTPFHLCATGALRYDIYEGENLLDDMYTVSPFANTFLATYAVPGEVLLAAVDELNGVSPAEVMRDRLFDWLDDQQLPVHEWLAEGEEAFAATLLATRQRDGDKAAARRAGLAVFALPNYVVTETPDPSKTYDVVANSYDAPYVWAAIEDAMEAVARKKEGTMMKKRQSLVVVDYRTDLDSSTLFIEHFINHMSCEDSEKKGGDKGLPDYGIALITLTVVGVVGAGGFFLYRRMRGGGYRTV